MLPLEYDVPSDVPLRGTGWCKLSLKLGSVESVGTRGSVIAILQ